jgi:frataxin-like iron-binding protein CyaY
MAIIDEYKQAIQDVMDGRAPEPPKPSEFPDTDDKLANFWAAAAALDMAGAPLPSVSSADNGKVLAVKNGAWAASEQGKKFIVTLTPTSEDYSGTMDKTVAEINAAYEAGMEIWFSLEISGASSFEFKCDTVGRASGHNYPSFNGVMYYANALVLVKTLTTNNGTKKTYSTSVYSLTPAS